MKPSHSADRLDFLKLIAHDVRWQILQALAESDLQVQEITRRLEQPQNLVSYHLQKLKRAGLVVENHSQADGRSVYYHLNAARVQRELQAVGGALLPLTLAGSRADSSRTGPLRVLFVCTHNSARSQMAEGLLRAWGGERVRAFSAGSDPRPVHPLAVQAMQEKNIDIRAQRAKGFDAVLPEAVLPDAVWKETAASDATTPSGDAWEPFDYVITVCDRARETCPTFPGHPVSIHWSIPDPAAVQGTAEEQQLAFRAAAEQLAQRIQNFLQREAIAGVEA